MSRMQLQISLGILLVLLTGGLLIVYQINEPNRMVTFTREEQGKAIEVGADIFDTNCKGCHGPQGEGVPGLWPPLNDKHFFNGRLQEVGWTGSQEDFIIATVSSGRLVSTRPDKYPGQGRPVMPAWSDRFGGPLRDDQIRSIAAFIMNWKSTAPDRSKEVAAVSGPPVGMDITVTLPKGDATRGEGLATAKGCGVCHITTPTGPAWNMVGQTPGIGQRAEQRINEGDYAGKATSADQYLFESIVSPNIHIVSGFQQGVMPQNYGQTITTQEMADLIEYLLTLK